MYSVITLLSQVGAIIYLYYTYAPKYLNIVGFVEYNQLTSYWLHFIVSVFLTLPSCMFSMESGCSNIATNYTDTLYVA